MFAVPFLVLSLTKGTLYIIILQEKNVNINALSPTIIDTKLLSKIDRRMLEVSGLTEKMLRVAFGKK